MSRTIKYLNNIAVASTIDQLDTVEDVSLNDAIFATQLAQTELLLELNDIKDFNKLCAIIDNKLRNFKKEINFLNKY